MANSRERKRAQSNAASSVQDELEECRAALRDKENEVNMLRVRVAHSHDVKECRAALRDKENQVNMLLERVAHTQELAKEKQRTIVVQQRAIEVQQTTIAAQQAAQVRSDTIENERVRILQHSLAEAKCQAEKDLALFKQELEKAKRDAQDARQEAQQARQEAQQARQEVQQAKREAQQAQQEAHQAKQEVQLAIERVELAESDAQETKSRTAEWMLALERRAEAAERIAGVAQVNVGRALGAFHRMADFGMAVVKRDEENISKLAATKKFIIANQARVERYGVQIIREDAQSAHLNVLRYSLMEGTESTIKEERDARRLEMVGNFLPTIDPDRIHAAFIDGGEEFVNRSPDQREIGFVSNVQRFESSWLLTYCLIGSRFSKYDFEDAISTAVVRAAVVGHDTLEELTESLDDLKLSLMTYPVDIKNKYRDLKASLSDLLEP